MDAAKLLIAVAATLGHGAIHVYLYNRINALLLRRKAIKRIEKFVLLSLAFWPTAIAITDWRWLLSAFTKSDDVLLTTFGCLWSLICIASLVMMLPLWIVGRIEYWKQRKHATNIKSEIIDVDQLMHGQLFKPSWLRKLKRFPFNEIHRLDISSKQLVIETLPSRWNGFRIAHLSDAHITGWYEAKFYALALSKLEAAKPDIVLLSGDIVDREHCFDKLAKYLPTIEAKFGCYFILGNHDNRFKQPDEVRDIMREIGWFDLGAACQQIETPRGPLQLMGNEVPWFSKPDRNISERNLLSQPMPDDVLRIAVAHSPDQWPWAIKSKCHVMVCGHTHGGQVRLPFIGPIIAPSWHGSRYASGIFSRSGTTMHVSRGLAGTQPLRIRCKPEASILTLRNT
jgi:uncharacterized protein